MKEYTLTLQTHKDGKSKTVIRRIITKEPPKVGDIYSQETTVVVKVEEIPRWQTFVNTTL